MGSNRRDAGIPKYSRRPSAMSSRTMVTLNRALEGREIEVPVFHSRSNFEVNTDRTEESSQSLAVSGGVEGKYKADPHIQKSFAIGIEVVPSAISPDLLFCRGGRTRNLIKCVTR